MQKFVKVGQTVAEISRFLAAILDLFAAFLGHSQSIFGGFYWCAKFGWNPCSSFDNMKV